MKYSKLELQSHSYFPLLSWYKSGAKNQGFIKNAKNFIACLKKNKLKQKN